MPIPEIAVVRLTLSARTEADSQETIECTIIVTNPPAKAKDIAKAVEEALERMLDR